MIIPPYITFTRSHMPATTPRSCVIRISAVSRSATSVAQQVEDLRLDRHVERRRRLVGDQQLRLAGERHRDHRPLAHAARELVRVVLQPQLGARDPDLLEQLRPRGRRASLRSGRSASRAPRGSGGRSSAPGSGSSSGPGRSSRSPCRGSLRSSRVLELEQVPALEHRPAAGDPRRCAARIPSIASEVTLFPQPDSPTIPSVSPGAMSNETPLTAWTIPRSVRNWTSRSRPREGSSGEVRDELASSGGGSEAADAPAASGRAPRAGRRRSG